MLYVRGKPVDHDLLETARVIEDHGSGAGIERLSRNVASHHLEQTYGYVSRARAPAGETANQANAQVDIPLRS